MAALWAFDDDDDGYLCMMHNEDQANEDVLYCRVNYVYDDHGVRCTGHSDSPHCRICIYMTMNPPSIVLAGLSSPELNL